MSSDVSLFDSDEENLNTNRNVSILDYVDEDDIIVATPQKPKKKRNTKNVTKSSKIEKPIMKTTTTSKVGNSSKENILHSTREFCVTRNNDDFIIINNYELENLNTRYKSPYVFYEIKDLLEFTEFDQPLNPNIKTIGIYEQKNVDAHYLIEHSKNDTKVVPQKILVDVKLLSIFPAMNQAVEIYGFIKFCKSGTTHFPVFIGTFWTSISSDLNRYLKCLTQQKQYVPCCYKQTTTLNELSQLELSEISNNYYFEEIDESCLNKNVENIEQICREIDEIMNINGDIFM